MKWIVPAIFAVSMTVSACGTPASDNNGSDDGDALTKDQARDRAGKGDATDFCERFGWYDDGICDDFCAKPDGDCDDAGNNGGNNGGGDGAGEGETCGGIAGIACADGLVCEHPAGSCGIADGAGTCVAEPEACIDLYDPVCGCDGQTYSNDCYALAAGATVDHDGECNPPQPGGCSDNSQCGDDEYCARPDDTCGEDIVGSCQPRAEFCPENYDPVCGCDGQTYSNACFATGAGVNVASAGECESQGDICGGFAGFTCPDGQVCQYAEGQCNVADAAGTCVPAADACPDVLDPVCGCDGKTYDNSCSALAAGMSVDHAGACETERACGGFLGQTCSDDEFCYFEPNTFCDYADASGVCKPRPDACTFEIDPVCGCDGKTYDNECMAAMAGTGLATDMACTN